MLDYIEELNEKAAGLTQRYKEDTDNLRQDAARLQAELAETRREAELLVLALVIAV